MTTAALTQDQQDMRLTGVGASEVAAIVGLSRYTRPIDIAARKLRLVEDPEVGQAAHWGNRLEAVIADAYAEEEGIEPALLIEPGTLRHPEHSIVLATPDRVRLTAECHMPEHHDAWPLNRECWDRNVQVKTASAHIAHRWGDGDDEVPDEYIVQCQWEMLVTGLAQTDLPVLIGGNDMRIYRLHADTELQGSLLETVERFWENHVKRGVLPPPDGTPQWSDYLKRRFPKDERPLLDATDEARELVSRLRDAKSRSEAAKSEEEQLAQQLKLSIGDAAGIAGLCTYKLQKGSTYTVTREPTRVLRLSKR